VSRGGEDRRAQAKVLDLTDRQLRVRATLRCTVKGVSARRPGLEARKRMSPPRPAVRTADCSMDGWPFSCFQRPPEA
jgi:hypothetical protein